MPDDTTNEILITRTITISGPHYDTSIDVEEPAEPDGIAVTIRQDNEHAAGNEDLIALTFGEWDVLADHVGLVQATYHNPDAGTAAYAADRRSREPKVHTNAGEPSEPTVADQVRERLANSPRATFVSGGGGGGGWGGPVRVTVVGAGAGKADGTPGEPGSVTLEPAETDTQRNIGRPNGQCRMHDSTGEWCWLPAGHPPVRFTGAGGGVRHIAGHVTQDGELFWAGV